MGSARRTVPISTRTRILLFFATLMATLGVLLLLAVRGTVIPSLTELYESKGRGLARVLAARAAGTGEEEARAAMARAILASDDDVLYAAVTGSPGIAREGAVAPPPEAGSLPGPGDGGVVVSRRETPGGGVIDFAVRIRPDGPEVARVALADAGLDRAVSTARRGIFVAAMAVFSLGMILLILGAKAVLHPIRLLTQLTTQIREGEYGVRVREAGRDEIGRLVSSVNAMSESLRVQRESLNEARAGLERKNAELIAAGRDLREGQEKLRALIESMSEGVVFADARGQLVFHNRSAARMLGREPGGLDGQRLARLGGGAWEAAIEEALRSFSDGAATGERLRVSSPDDPIESFLNAVRDDDGRYLGAVLVCQDLTERNRLEAERKTLEARLSHQDKMAALGSLAASVAHELNTPLGTVLLQAQLLGRSLPDPVHGERVATIEAEVKRCRGIVGNLLDFTRRSERQRAPVQACEVVERAARLTANGLRLKGLRLEWRAEADLPPLLGDRDQLLQVLLNLIQNAADASEPGAMIRLGATRAAAGEIVFTVTDEGSGIPDDVLPRMFDQFFTTKAATGGTGLGLPTCERIVRQHGGRIAVESRTGVGTTLRVHLPVEAT